MHTTIEEVLRSCIDALGGLKVVGHKLRPHMDPVLAGQWLAHTLDPERREKLELGQVVLVLQLAKGRGYHAGAEALNLLLGYRVTAVVDDRELLADKVRQAEAHAQAATTLSTECIELMRHAGLKVDSA
jgi:hypothetical protein